MGERRRRRKDTARHCSDEKEEGVEGGGSDCVAIYQPMRERGVGVNVYIRELE